MSLYPWPPSLPSHALTASPPHLWLSCPRCSVVSSDEFSSLNISTLDCSARAMIPEKTFPRSSASAF